LGLEIEIDPKTQWDPKMPAGRRTDGAFESPWARFLIFISILFKPGIRTPWVLGSGSIR